GVADVQFQHPVGDVREEKIEVNGKVRDCWVVTTASSPSDQHITTWIDKELWIDWKVVAEERTPRDKFSIEMTLGKFDLTFDPVLPDSLFVFAPPPGSKQYCCRDVILVQ